MRTSRRLVALTSILLVAAAAGCGSKDGPAPNGAEIKGVGHKDKVESPFTVEMKADDVDIAAAGEARPGEGHFHILVDIPCVQGGEVIPEGEGYLHFDEGETEAELDLEPGTHDLCLQVADGEDVAFVSDAAGVSADKTHEIEITVED